MLGLASVHPSPVTRARPAKMRALFTGQSKIHDHLCVTHAPRLAAWEAKFHLAAVLEEAGLQKSIGFWACKSQVPFQLA